MQSWNDGDQIQLTLDEHQALHDAKAKDLEAMVGSVSIRTVDASEFEENAVHQKSEVEEEGYMGGKVGQTDRQQAEYCVFVVCAFST